MKVLTEPELVAIGEKQGRPFVPADAEAVERAVKNDLQMAVDVKELIKQAIQKHKG